MGCPEDLTGSVVKLEPCPVIAHSAGRVILTTVHHLNAACRELTVRSSAGLVETLQTTDFHPFWSETKQGWVQAYTLAIGDQLQGRDHQPVTLIASHRLPGRHTVYNLTIESDHIYRVGFSATLVHNNCGSGRGGPYGHLKDHPSVNSSKPFTQSQKKKILAENETRNGGQLLDDVTGEPLVRPQQHKHGVTPPDNEAHIDHVYPCSEGGPNTFSNAEVRARIHNLKKGNKIE